MVFEGWKGPMAVLLGLGAGSSRRRGRGGWGVKPVSPGFLLHSWKGEACWQGYPGDLFATWPWCLGAHTSSL